MWTRIEEFILISRNIIHWLRSVKMIVTICYFLKSVKPVFILVHVAEQKLYCTFNNCSLCDRLNLRKNRFVCALWSSVLMKSVVEQEFFHEFAFNNKVLKTLVECSKFERCRIQIRTSSHPQLCVSAKGLLVEVWCMQERVAELWCVCRLHCGTSENRWLPLLWLRHWGWLRDSCYALSDGVRAAAQCTGDVQPWLHAWTRPRHEAGMRSRLLFTSETRRSRVSYFHWAVSTSRSFQLKPPLLMSYFTVSIQSVQEQPLSFRLQKATKRLLL